MTHVYISFYVLHMKFINRLATVLKLEVIFLISPKLLIKFCTNVLFLIQNKMGWKQRVVLNLQHSKWSNMSTGVTKGPILGRLLFLICINDSSNNLSSNPKLFADDTSLFWVVHDINQSWINLNDDLEKISNWDSQWKMSFSPDINKRAQEVILSHRLQKSNYPPLTFNGTSFT